MLPRSVYVAFRIVIPLLIAVAGVAGFIGLAGLRETPELNEVEKTPPLVETAQAEPHSGELTIHADGSVVPFREAPLSAEVAGRITWRSPDCRAGQVVQKGDLLFRISQHEYQLEVERLTHEQKKAQASLKELQVQIENARSIVELAEDELALRTRELRRVQRLADQNAASPAEIDQAEQAEQVARRTLVQQQNQLRLEETRKEGLQTSLELVGTQLERARLDLARTEVKAPVSGVVVSAPVEADSFVQRGTLLVTIEDSSAAEVQCSLTMDELYWLWQHRGSEPPSGASAADPVETAKADFTRRGIPEVPVSVTYELAGQKFVWNGKLSRYEGAGLDSRTRMVPCRVLVPRPENVSLRASENSPPALASPPALLRGMYVSLDFHAAPTARILKVPEAAVRPGNVLWLVRDGRLKRQVINGVRIVDETAYVPASGSGLEAGDQVVVSPLATEVDGQEVRIAGAAPVEAPSPDAGSIPPDAGSIPPTDENPDDSEE